MANIIENQEIICLSTVDWDPIWTRKQQVMSRLPVSNRILYVEPPISLLSPFKDPACWKKWRLWREGLRQWSENIYLYSPPVIAPLGNIYQQVNRVNQAWLAPFIRRAAKKLNFRKPLLWTYLPNSADLIGKLGEKLVIYDCVDEHSAYTGFNPETVWGLEKKLLKQTDIVFTTAQGLYEKRKPYSKEIHLIPNAADVEHFQKAVLPETPLAPEMKGLPHPVIGFIGVLQDWIDLDLIADLAEARPSWSFVLVGPAGPGINLERLQSLPNVHLLGRRDKEVLPSYFKGFDICLNVFRLNQLTSTVSPLKFYEYLASGKPVVSVPLPAVEPFSDVVEIARNPAEFLQKIEHALSVETPERQEQRLRRARENSWEQRVIEIMEKIAPKL
jgi:glycosyltransferase involved in cell wall biosynthesis